VHLFQTKAPCQTFAAMVAVCEPAPAATEEVATAADSAAPAASETPAPATEAAPAAAVAEKDDKAAESATAASAAADSAAPAASEAKAPERTVLLAGRRFSSKTELADHVKKIQESVSDDEGRLSTEACLFLFHLFLHHPKAVEKMNTPISHFRYGLYETFKNKCFIMVRADGTQEGVSAMKSLQAVFGDATHAPVVATVSHTPKEEEPRGEKREREIPEPEPPREFEPVVMVRGCVVDIHGCPASVDFNGLKDMLAEFGKVRYVKIIQSAKRARKRKEESAVVPEAAEGSASSASAAAPSAEGDKVAEATVGDKPAAMDTEEKPEAAASTAAPEAGGDKAADAKVADEAAAVATEEKPEADSAMDAEDGSEDSEDNKTIARCRFFDPEGAQRALDGVAEVQGLKVQAGLLTGADEEAFWAEVNAGLKAVFDKGGKDKGKARTKEKAKVRARARTRVRKARVRKTGGESKDCGTGCRAEMGSGMREPFFCSTLESLSSVSEQAVKMIFAESLSRESAQTLDWLSERW